MEEQAKFETGDEEEEGERGGSKHSGRSTSLRKSPPPRIASVMCTRVREGQRNDGRPETQNCKEQTLR